MYVEVEISFYLLKRLLGVKTAEGGKAAKVRLFSCAPPVLPACQCVLRGNDAQILLNPAHSERVQWREQHSYHVLSPVCSYLGVGGSCLPAAVLLLGEVTIILTVY